LTVVKPNSQFDALARNAADRIRAARDAGEQLALFADPAQVAVPEDGAAVARAPRGRGKATVMLNDWLAARGLRLPEDRLAEIAGLASDEDVFIAAMQRTEQVLAWAEAGATAVKGTPATATLPQRMQTFQVVFTAMVRAAEALLPYARAKVTPDVHLQAPVAILMAGPGGAVGLSVEGGADAFAPLDVRYGATMKTVTDQEVTREADADADAAARTEGTSR
jgi:hypothetical protein